MSIVGQNLETISHSLMVLNSAVNSQYGIRGQPRFDKVSVVILCSLDLLCLSLFCEQQKRRRD